MVTFGFRRGFFELVQFVTLGRIIQDMPEILLFQILLFQ
jgi:hypothetical protein